jgi:type II secretion system protein N
VRTFFLLVGAAFWSAFVFVTTWWLTFPSEEFGQRIRAEVPLRLGRGSTADVGPVGPWWLGVSASELKLYDDGPEGAELRAYFTEASVALSPFRSLFRRTPYFTGELEFLDGWLGFQIGTAQTGKKGNNWGMSDLVLWSDQVPIGDLLHLTDRVPASITGNVSLDVDVRGGSGGLSESTGHIKLAGTGLGLSGLEIPNVGPLGMEIPIDSINLDAKVENGQVTFEPSFVRSSMFTLEIKGTLGLRDPVERSNVDLEFVLTELGAELKGFEGFLTSAKGPDGAYHFFCRGVLQRMSASSCSAGKPGISGRATRRAAADDLAEDGEGVDAGMGDPNETDAERQQRRAELREKLKARREERRAERLGKTPPVVPTKEVDPAPVEPDEEPVVEEPEEPPPDEEPLPEEEEPLE